MTRRFLTSLLLIAASLSSQAQAAETSLREALDIIPEAVFSGSFPLLASFVDISALNQLGDDDTGYRSRLVFASGLRPLEALMFGDTASWSGHAGVDLSEIRYFAGFGQPPHSLSIWGLADSDQADQLLANLNTAGFSPLDGHDGMLANGQPMAADISKRDPGDPWRGMIGQTSVVAAHGSAVFHAAGPAPVAMARQAQRSLVDTIAFDVALSGIEHVAADGVIVQAGMFSPTLGLSAIDPMSAILAHPLDGEAARTALEEAVQNASIGIPPYFAAIIADIQLADSISLAISLAYPDCETAGEGARLAAARWRATIGREIEGEATTETVPGLDGFCAAVISVAAPIGENQANVPLASAFSEIMRGQFAVLQIGAPQ